jgi:hypothetical protein
MGVQWVLASVTVALVAAGTGGAVLLTSGPLGDDSQTETLQQPPVSGELNRQKDPEGTASDSENERAREAALADREIADWLSSRGDWNLLWVDLYDISDDKDQSCSPGPCVESCLLFLEGRPGSDCGPGSRVRAHPRLASGIARAAANPATQRRGSKSGVGGSRSAAGRWRHTPDL